MNTLVLLAVSFGTAVMLTGLLRTAALNIGFLDKPVARSSHSIPTPIGGGLAIVLPVFVASTFIFYAGQLEKGLFLSLFGAYAVAIVGLIDDLKNVHAIWRIPLHFGAALWSLLWLGEVPPLDFFFFTINKHPRLFLLPLIALVLL
ncbi:MAG: glycosyl transferase, partial [Pseudomonadota bacterium]|nr:glycosyl transferase [Pseudomonadota bacterium]